MDGSESIFVKEACRILGLSRAQADRLRRAGQFVDSFELTGAPNGKVSRQHQECIARVVQQAPETDASTTGR
jgi:hypothetical protein